MISVTEHEFEQAVSRALDDIPEEFRPYLENVLVEVADHPDASAVAGEDLPADLLGLYVGCPVPEQGSEGGGGALPHRVLIFRENLCAVCDDYEELIEEIRVTVLHEIGHHFGLDEDQLEALGYD